MEQGWGGGKPEERGKEKDGKRKRETAKEGREQKKRRRKGEKDKKEKEGTSSLPSLALQAREEPRAPLCWFLIRSPDRYGNLQHRLTNGIIKRHHRGVYMDCSTKRVAFVSFCFVFYHIQVRAASLVWVCSKGSVCCVGRADYQFRERVKMHMSLKLHLAL